MEALDYHGPQTLSVIEEGGRLRTDILVVEVLEGPDRGRRFEVPGLEARIGTGGDCEVRLQDPTVGRLHACLRIEQSAIRVTDAGSRHGTRIDGLRIVDAYARSESLLVLGETTMVVTVRRPLMALPLSQRDRFGALLGRSMAMRRVFALLERLAMSDTPVLLEGETGTGKELAARGLHEQGVRAEGPFVVLDCTSLTPTLAESMLFGHVRGAFTGAERDYAGFFVQADGGTLFLDELGELPRELQPKLLRAIETQEVQPLGSGKRRKVDVRIIAATNRLLLREVDRGLFREDLYYRVAVTRVRLPPLRERLEDVPLLVRHFEAELGRKQPRPPLTEATVHALASQSWPGNVRALRNAVMCTLSLGWHDAAGEGREGGMPPFFGAETSGIHLHEPLLTGRNRVGEKYQEIYVQQVLAHTRGNVTQAAAIAGVSRNFMYQLMRRYGLLGGEVPGRDRRAGDDNAW